MKPFGLFLCLSLVLKRGLLVRRDRVVPVGTTVGPGFKRIEAKGNMQNDIFYFLSNHIYIKN